MKGGLKKRNPVKTLFQPVYDMIMHPDTHFSVMVISSLKGFMISMQVTEEASEYLNRDTGGRFRIPVTNFLFKFAIVTSGDETLSPFTIGGESYSKSSEPKQDFYQEAILQQTLWLNSIEGGKIEVCPSVVGLAFLRNPRQFFALIKSKINGQPPNKFDAVERYLLTELQKNPTWELGIIVQSLVENSFQIADFIDNSATREEEKNEAIIYAGAQLLRLFLFYKVIHLDTHLGNILVVNNNGNIKCFIIDFGLVCVFRSDLQKNTDLDLRINNKWITFSNQMFPNVEPLDPEKITQKIFSLMLSIDLANLNKNFRNRRDPLRTYQKDEQMYELFKEINTRHLFKKIYDKYVEISTPNPNRTSTPHDVFIGQNVESGYFELINQPVANYTISENFNIPLPPPPTTNNCIPCTKKDCITGAVAGATCCIGSCALYPGLGSAAIGVGSVATGLGVALASQKINRGGKKSKTKRSKTKRTKRSKKYKRFKR